MVLRTLVHESLQLLDLVMHQLSLDWHQVAERIVVAAEQLLQFVDVAHVVFLLEGNVRDGRRDWLTDAIQELGLSDSDTELRVEVDVVDSEFILLLGGLDAKNELLESSDCRFSVLLLPGVEDLLLVILIKLLGKSDVLGSHLHESICVQLASLGLELFDRSLDTAHD